MAIAGTDGATWRLRGGMMPIIFLKRTLFFCVAKKDIRVFHLSPRIDGLVITVAAFRDTRLHGPKNDGTELRWDFL